MLLLNILENPESILETKAGEEWYTNILVQFRLQMLRRKLVFTGIVMIECSEIAMH